MIFGDAEIIVAVAIELFKLILVVSSSRPCDFISCIMGSIETIDGIIASSTYIIRNITRNENICTGNDGEAKELPDSSNISDFIFNKKSTSDLQYKIIVL